MDRRIKKKRKERDARLLLQVHDELLFEIKDEALEEMAVEIKRTMENVVSLKVPLIVDVKAGRNWGSQEAVTGN